MSELANIKPVMVKPMFDAETDKQQFKALTKKLKDRSWYVAEGAALARGAGAARTPRG